MTALQVANVIRSRYKTLVADTQSLPTCYDNAPFNKPDDATKWSRLTVLLGETLQVSLGTTLKRYRTVGVAIAEIFTPANTGDSVGLTLAETVRASFRGITVSGVVFQAPTIENIGLDGAEWKVNVTIPFYADDVG